MQSLGQSTSSRYVSPPLAKLPAEDEWLLGACKALAGRDNWSVADHHRARIRWTADNAPSLWTDSTRRMAWVSVLQYAHLCNEKNIPLLPLPPTIAAAPLEMPSHSTVITASATHFLCRPHRNAFIEIALASAGLHFKSRLKAYSRVIDIHSAAAVRKLATEYGFALDEAAESAIYATEEAAEESRRASAAKSGSFHVDGLAIPPHPYQQAGIAYMVAKKRVLLADDMGLGKTLQALAAVQALAAWPAGVVTLASVKDGWRAEALAALPGIQVQVWNGKTGVPEVHGAKDAERVLHVINYTILPDRLAEWQALALESVILDESHTIKNRKSKCSTAARELMKKKRVRFCLTGTPAENRPAELLPQVQALGRLDDLGGFRHFVVRYLGAKFTKFGKGRSGYAMNGAQNLAELNTVLRETCLVRRRKEDVLTELPPTIITRVPVPFSRDGQALYDCVRRDVKAWISQRATLKPSFLASIAHLPPEQQESAKALEYAAAMERISGMELLHQFSELRHAAVKAKIPAVVDWLAHHAELQKMVFFGNFKLGVRGLAAELKAFNPVVIDGDTPVKDRPGLIAKFEKDDSVRIALCNYKAAGTGVNGLQRASSHFVTADWPWTPAALRQAVSRLHRQGQRHTVHQWHLFTPDTCDDESLDMLSSKADVCDALTDGGEARQQEAFTRARKAAVRMIL